MKKFLAIIVLGIASLSAYAEASFDQVQNLIQQKNYSAAEKGLEGIIANHPNSAKAFYAMAQAQAGLGNQEKAKKALDIATGLNPTLDFAPQSSVQSLKDAITPQTTKIVAVEESHTFRNFMLFVMVIGFGLGGYILFTMYMRKQEEEAASRKAEYDAAEAKVKRMQAEREAEEEAERRANLEARAKQARAEAEADEAKEAALRAHKNYGHERFDPANPDKLKTVKQMKEEAAAQELRQAQALYERAEADARRARLSASYAPAQPAVVNNHYGSNNSGSDLVTGMMIGNMMSDHHHHDTTVIVQQPSTVYVETPAKAPRSSWDDIDSTPRKSSTWDDTPAPSRSSSWDDTPSKSSSSSWSSSSSDSSSSWSDSSSSSDSGSSSWD